MLDPVPSLKSVMNAILALSRADVQYVEDQVFQMPITAKSAAKWRKIGMGVQKL